jgi:hypothetical protein
VAVPLKRKGRNTACHAAYIAFRWLGREREGSAEKTGYKNITKGDLTKKEMTSDLEQQKNSQQRK